MLKQASLTAATLFFLCGCFTTETPPTTTPDPSGADARLKLTGTSESYRDRMLLTAAAPEAGVSIEGTWKEVATDSCISEIFEPAGGGLGGPIGGGPIIYAGADSSSDKMIRVYDEVLMTPAVAITPAESYPPSLPGSGTGITPQAGLMTAGEWYDHRHWGDFQDYLRKYPEYFQTWGMDLQRRVRIRFVDQNGTPLPDADVKLLQGGETVFTGRSYADGTIAFFPTAAEENFPLSAEVAFSEHGSEYRLQLNPVKDDDQIWDATVPAVFHPVRPAMDLAFVVDVTGSMGDELQFLQQELLDITAKAFQGIDADLRIGVVFYRDRGDDFVTRVFPFSNDVERVTGWLKGMRAGGGGDIPESVDRALCDAFHSLKWDDRGAVRLAFLIGDAPPHYYADETYTYKEAASEAARRGIKIMPVAASGADRSTEYLFRMLAVQTEGKYIFITDDSGIGSTHLEADVGRHDVESLNGILARTLRDELSAWPGVEPDVK